MIKICPNCGRFTGHPINDGITTCQNCGKIFDTSTINLILSAAWHCIRMNLENISEIQDQYHLSQNDADIIQYYIIDHNYSHDKFLKIIKNNMLIAC